MTLTNSCASTIRSNIGVLLPALRVVSNGIAYRSPVTLAAASTTRLFSSCRRQQQAPRKTALASAHSASRSMSGASTAATSIISPATEEAQTRTKTGSTTKAATATGPLWSNERIEQFLHARRSLIRDESTNRPLRTAAREANAQDAFAATHTPEEVAEVRHLAEYLTSSPPRQSDWIFDTCLLCFQYELYDSCCELFFHHVAHRAHLNMPPPPSRVSAGEKEVLFNFVIEAAGRARDLPSLCRCHGFAVTLREEANGDDGVTPNEPSAKSAATSVTVHLCNLYWHCIRLSFLPSEKAREGDLAALTVQVLEALNVQDGADTRAADFMKQSQHHYRYNEGERNKKAAISLQLFEHWCRVLGSHQPLHQWLDVTVLHHVLRAAVSSNRFDLVEYLTLYVDMLLLVPAAQTTNPGAASGGAIMQRKREWDGVIITVLRFFSLTRQTARAVQWLGRLREQHPDYRPNTQVCVVVARAAANAQDVALSTWCLETLLADQPAMPSARDWFDCICAVARSGLPNYKQVLQSLLENDLLRLSQEELLYVNLLHCRRSCLWREELESLLHGSIPLGDDAAASQGQEAPLMMMQEASSNGEARAPTELLSSRNVHMALLILHEMEHPSFMRYYRYFLHLTAWRATPEERAKWCIFAVVWATTQMGHLRNDDLYFILQEYGQLQAHTVRLSGEDGGRPAVLPRTAHSLQTKWSALYVQHPEWWWKKLFRKNQKVRPHGAGEPRPPLDLQAVVRPRQGTSAALTARFLKRKQRVQLNVGSLTLFDRVTEKAFQQGNVVEAHKRDGWSLCFHSKIE